MSPSVSLSMCCIFQYASLVSSVTGQSAMMSPSVNLSMSCIFQYANIKSEMRSFKSNENIRKKEGGSYYVVLANKASSVTL